MILIDGEHLTFKEIEKIAKGEKVSLSKRARGNIKRAHEEIEKILSSGKAVYGVNTGVGELAEVRIPKERLEKLQTNIVRSHAVGVGAPLDRETVRTIMALRANTLARGYSGVREEVVDLLIEFLNRDIIPVVPEKGSVGASGDLAPLAHIALALIGEGDVFYKNGRIPSREAFRAEGIKPLKLKPKEGIALINGTQATLGVLTLTYLKARKLIENSDVVASLTLYALSARLLPFDKRVSELRPHPGQKETSEKIRNLLSDAETGGKRVQDAYSLRCIPQVHGTVRDGISWVKKVLERELNAMTDNPLVFPLAPPGSNVISAGNFHGQILSLASDALSIVLTSLSGISERRTFRLLSSHLSGLSPFLTKESGTNSGLMMLQVTQAALVAESRALSHPFSVDSIPTSADQEDYVSMSMGSALRTRKVLENASYVLAGELISAMQGIFLKGEKGLGDSLLTYYTKLRNYFHPIKEDRFIGPEITLAKTFLLSNLDEL